MMKYSLVNTGQHETLSVWANDRAYICDSTHPHWNQIVDGVLALDESVLGLFDISSTVADVFEEITERVSVANGRVYFDGDEVDNSLSKAIVRAVREGNGFYALARFMENLAANPNEHSKENLYRWLADRDFTITDDGCLIAYKGVNFREEDQSFVSVSSGTAYVNGVRQEGQIPNFVGAVVTMPRSEVQHDPSTACSVGLHAGQWSYASAFGSAGTLKVKINPRDVVSVPSDSNSEKMRVCRYQVLELVEKPVADLVDEEEYDFDNFDEYEEEFAEPEPVPVTQVGNVQKRSFWPFSK